jgi:hypothetical protein
VSSRVWLDLAPAHAVASARLTLEVPAAKATVPVDGPPLTLHWGSSAEPFDAMDYATLSVVLAILFGVAALTNDAQETALAVILTYAVLTWEPSRAVLLRMLRNMQGR